MGLFNASTARAAGQMKILVNDWGARRIRLGSIEIGHKLKVLTDAGSSRPLLVTPEQSSSDSTVEFYGARYLDCGVLKELREHLLRNGLVGFDDRNGFLAGLLASQ